MLVLTRKVGDVIAIDDNIKIVVMAIKGKQVRLGVQADKNVVVHREEVYQKIQQEICAAMTSDVHNTKTAGDLLKIANPLSEQHPILKQTMRFIKKSPSVGNDDDFEDS